MLLLFCRFVQMMMIKGVMIGRGLGKECLHGGHKKISLSAFVWLRMREMENFKKALGGRDCCFFPSTTHNIASIHAFLLRCQDGEHMTSMLRLSLTVEERSLDEGELDATNQDGLAEESNGEICKRLRLPIVGSHQPLAEHFVVYSRPRTMRGWTKDGNKASRVRCAHEGRWGCTRVCVGVFVAFVRVCDSC